AAIVSDRPGTTRDVIEVHLDVGGYAVTVVDTAGLRISADEIETEGVRRAQRQAADADIKIVLFDGAYYPARDAETTPLIGDNSLVVINKADVVKGARDPGVTFISVTTGAGLDAFMEQLAAMIRARFETGADAPLTRARHRRGLEDCVAALERAGKA